MSLEEAILSNDTWSVRHSVATVLREAGIASGTAIDTCVKAVLDQALGGKAGEIDIT